jgi:hypothetical protein
MLEKCTTRNDALTLQTAICGHKNDMRGTQPRKTNIVLQAAVHIFPRGETINIALQYQLLLSSLRG